MVVQTIAKTLTPFTPLSSFLLGPLVLLYSDSFCERYIYTRHYTMLKIYDTKEKYKSILYPYSHRVLQVLT